MAVGSRSRLVLWLLVPLVVGTSTGLATSKFLWNYFWSPPTVHVDSGARPATLAVFRAEPIVQVLPAGTRNELLARELQACWEGRDDCTWGRVLMKLSADAWLETPVPDVNEVESAVVLARQAAVVPFFQSGQYGSGFVATYASDGEVRTLVAFQTWELRDDTYGYVELLLRRSGGVAETLDSVHYFFDVAGIEFATPGVLATLGIVLAYLVALAFLALRSVVSLIRSRPGRPV